MESKYSENPPTVIEENDRAENNYPAGQSVTIHELIEIFFELNANKWRPNTKAVYLSLTKYWILPYFENVSASEINETMLKEWLNFLKKSLCTSTIKRIVTQLKLILDIGVTHYGLSENPVNLLNLEDISGKEQSKKLISVWTEEEFNEFINNVVDDPHFHLFFNILFYTGMKPGEITGLLYKDINIETGEIKISKTLQKVNGDYVLLELSSLKSRRSVYIMDNILEEYRKYVKVIRRIGSLDENNRIFFKQLPNYTNYLNKICNEYGLKSISLSEFRPSIARELVGKGIPVKKISNWLGNSRISQTLKYLSGQGNSPDSISLKEDF